MFQGPPVQAGRLAGPATEGVREIRRLGIAELEVDIDEAGAGVAHHLDGHLETDLLDQIGKIQAGRTFMRSRNSGRRSIVIVRARGI